MDQILRVLPGGLMAMLLALPLAAAGEPSASGPAASSGPALTAPANSSPQLPLSAPPSLIEMPIATPVAAPAPTPTQTPAAEAAPGKAPAEPVAEKSSPLPSADANEDRSVQLEQVARQADEQTRHGFELAGRRAYFAARVEFLGALRLVAEGLDAERRTKVHSRALAAALVALREAEDFLPGAARAEADVDVPGLIAVHSTPALKTGADQVSPLAALRCYLTFAQEQLAVATGHELAGSMALHAMGKLHAAWSQKKGTPILAAEAKAVVFYQAALLVYPRNYMAANDLGVLMAQGGHYADARKLLEYSLSLRPQSTGWQNLAVVYRQLSQPALAARAAQQATQLHLSEPAGQPGSSAWANNRVMWLDPQSFAETSVNAVNPPGAPPVPNGTPALATDASRASPGGRPPVAAMRPAGPAASAAGQSSPDPAAGPAPTPAAAQRMLWASPAYQR
jgi:tetratricopeptide (TPR) repeat protein